MIVRTLPESIQLVTQPDHARLAGRIMEDCLPLAMHARRASILLAAAEHDNGWIEEDAAPAVDADGRVVDFVTAPLSVRHGVWPRAIARLAGDPWAAALVAQHAITVYDRFRVEPEWSTFFAEMEVGARRNGPRERVAAAGPGHRLSLCPPRRSDLADVLRRLDGTAALPGLHRQPIGIADHGHAGDLRRQDDSNGSSRDRDSESAVPRQVPSCTPRLPRPQRCPSPARSVRASERSAA